MIELKTEFNTYCFSSEELTALEKAIREYHRQRLLTEGKRYKDYEHSVVHSLGIWEC